MNNFATSLRPGFTGRIATYLSSGQSVNVFSREEHGLKKLVEDVRKSSPEGNACIVLSMRSYAHSFKGFLMALCDALHLKPAEGDDLRSTLLSFIENHPGQIWLCLEDFDRLTERTVDTRNVDAKGYNIDFLNHLNSFRNIPRISLLFTSASQLATQELYIGGERVRGSILDIPQRLSLPRLDFKEIEDYLKEMVSIPAMEALKEKSSFYTLLITEIAAHPNSSEFIEYISDKIPLDPATHLAEFEERMRFWKQDFTANHALSLDLRLNNMARDTTHWSRRAGRMVGIGRSIKSIHKKLLVLGALLLPIGYFWWGKIAAFFEWIFSFIK